MVKRLVKGSDEVIVDADSEAEVYWRSEGYVGEDEKPAPKTKVSSKKSSDEDE